FHRHVVPKRGVLRLNHPAGQELRFHRETLELSADAQQLVVFLPADGATARAADQLRDRPFGGLRAVT
ncbi:MmyB family transcriptional regulator, partial [Marinitenerispora sediminis]